MLSTEIITFVITRDDYFILFRLIDKQVPDAIRKLRTSCTISPLNSDPAASFQSFVESSHYLYTQLIEPVYEKIRGKRLIIIPHNQLTQVPFEVLIREKPAAGMTVDYRPLRYLVREFPVSYAFSANLLIDRDHRKYGSNTAIFVPDYNSAGKEDMIYSALAGAAFESRTIRRLTGGRLFNRDKADELTFKTRAPRYRILHIASHAVMDEKNSDLSYLIMTAPVDTPEDGNLYSYEISQMELKAQLVVLSGCNTGYGLLRQSEGLISIARSFLYTGIRSVAYTLWPLSDKTGSDLVCSFYQAIRSRQTLDKAMRTAKLSFLENADPVRSHPFYWAGYVIAGRTESVPVFGMFYWIMLGAAAITITFVFWFMYRKIRF
jgi:CHAT domain-containing protein